MSSYAYALIVVGFVNVLFGIYILITAIKAQTVSFLALSFISVGLWGIGLAGFLGAKTDICALAWAKFHYVASIYVIYYVLLFILVLVRGKKVKISTRLFLHLPILLLSCAVVFSNKLIITGVSIEDSGNVAFLNKLGHVTYGVVFVIYYIVALVLNLVSAVKSYGINKKQRILIFIGLLLTGILSGIFNLLLPIMGNYKLIWVGPQFTIVFLGLMFIAIVRYQLFNIRLLVGKIVYILGSAILIYASFILFFNIHNLIFSSVTTWGAIIFGVVTSILFSLIYDKYKDFLQSNISSRIINLGYESSKYIEKFTDSLGNIVTEDSILKKLHSIIKETINPIYFSILIRREKGVINKQYTGNKVFDADRIFKLVDVPLFHGKNSISLGEMIGILQMDDLKYKSHYYDLVNILQTNDLYLLIPVYYDDKLISIFILGKRDLNSSMYIQQEITFLESLALLTGASLTRATLYKQVEDFNKDLKKKVDEQTKELQQKVEELEEARRKERDMLDIMGHELRTPATIVKLNTGLLEKYINSNPENFKKYLNRIKNSIENEIRLINTLLSSAKLEGKKIEMNKERISIPEQIETVLHGYEYQAEAKGLKMISDIDEDTKDVYADKVRVVEILDNLISNAIKYTDEGSVI
ncbi:MAG TPA: histidine kinase N-terminal 7TM domain-containing protein, partial [Candidatus Pacearchaeota archaeon]|nr:histidine kinase N-terminal 7TM domain-containing protein [Candidatus Pacearchaeota archaeon]